MALQDFSGFHLRGLPNPIRARLATYEIPEKCLGGDIQRVVILDTVSLVLPGDAISPPVIKSGFASVGPQSKSGEGRGMRLSR